MSLLRQGFIKGAKVGKFWRVKQSDLDDYIENERGYGGFRFGHASNDKREIFYDLIESIWDDNQWLGSEENRFRTRRIAGLMYNCIDIVPSEVRSSVGDIIDDYLRDFDRANKYRAGCNCGMAARSLLDILDKLESK